MCNIGIIIPVHRSSFTRIEFRIVWIFTIFIRGMTFHNPISILKVCNSLSEIFECTIVGIPFSPKIFMLTSNPTHCI